jgi:hypothetical protein
VNPTPPNPNISKVLDLLKDPDVRKAVVKELSLSETPSVGLVTNSEAEIKIAKTGR